MGLAAFHSKLMTSDLLGFECATNWGRSGILAWAWYRAVTVFSGNEGQPLDLVEVFLIDLLQHIYAQWDNGTLVTRICWPLIKKIIKLGSKPDRSQLLLLKTLFPHFKSRVIGLLLLIWEYIKITVEKNESFLKFGDPRVRPFDDLRWASALLL